MVGFGLRTRRSESTTYGRATSKAGVPLQTELIITGSGTPIPSAGRAGPGALVKRGELALQFDAGRSTVQRLAGVGIWPTQLSALFVTHHHSDHLTGLQDVVLTRWTMDRLDDLPPLPIIAPAGAASEFVERMLVPWTADIEVRLAHTGRSRGPTIDLVSFDVPDRPTEVWSSGDVRVMAGQVRHEPVFPAVGYRIEGPEGVVVISGDTLVCDEVAELAEGADVLVYEALRFACFDGLPARRTFILDYHADTRLIGAQARDLDVKTLVLTHLIPEPMGPDDVQAFVDDIRAGGFEGDLVVADDLDRVGLS